MFSRFRAAIFAVVVTCACILSPGSAFGQEKSATKEGFTLSQGAAKIILFRPQIKAGAQSTGGMFEPNADWTDQAKENIGAALASAQNKLGNSVTEYIEPVGIESQKLAEYRALFQIVAEAVITYKFFPGNRLPTKKRQGVFDWTLGSGIRDLAGTSGADYGLFIYTEDHYGSTGRKMLQLFAAMGGVSVTSGVHKGFAGLVDLKTGDLVWLNADLAMGGDVCTTDGSNKRVAQLLEDFPGSTAFAAAQTNK